MDPRHLIKMANEIGSYFEPYPDRAEAIRGIARHLRNFWAPQMRAEIIAYVRRGGGDLKDIVREAVIALERDSVKAA